MNKNLGKLTTVLQSIIPNLKLEKEALDQLEMVLGDAHMDGYDRGYEDGKEDGYAQGVSQFNETEHFDW